MKFTARHYARFLHTLLEKAGEKNKDAAINAFLKLLEKHKQTRLLERIVREYERFLLQNDALPMLSVKTKEALSDDIKESIRAKFNLPSNTLVEESIDEAIIGGLVIKYNNMLFDFSLQNRLTKLKQQLTR